VNLRAFGLFFLWSVVVSSQAPAGEIRGTLVDELNAVPLHTPGIELRGEGIRRVVQAGASGYRIPGLPAGVYDLTITGSFLVPTTIRSVRLKAGEIRVLPPVETVLSIFECGRRYDFLRPLDQGDAGKGSLAGTVVDNHGSPLPDARVRVHISNAGIIASGKRYQIEVTHDGYYTEDFADFRVLAGYEAVYYRENLEACEHGRCIPALRPVRLLPYCG
jgi:hypothetical protein